MKSMRFVCALVLCALVWSPPVARAQEASVSGAVKDSTGGVLPGVTVTALHVASGTTFVGVTNEQGVYLIGITRPGVYTITTDLTGFSRGSRENIELLVGQRVVLDFTLRPSSVEESITVTAETPLVDLTQSQLGGNVDSRQMQNL